MRVLSWRARACVLCTALAAALCAAPALRRSDTVEWRVVAPLAVLCLLCEWLPGCPPLSRALRGGSAGTAAGPGTAPGWACPVALAGAFLLSPAAAALVPVPSALLGRAEPPAAARRIWHAAQLALAAWSAVRVRELLMAPGAVEPAAAGFPGVLLPAAAATLAFGTVLFVSDGAILIAAERRSPRGAWRERPARWIVPQLVQGCGGLMMAVLWRSPYGAVSALFVLLPILVSSWASAQYQRERAAHLATVRALVQAVDIKDRYTRGHSERVGRAAVLIGRELGMAEGRVETLRFAGVLHDVGKLGVPTRVLRKNGPLTEEERRIVRLHPEFGHEMVRDIRFLGEARAAVLHHHERLDGTGYPHGLSGSRIPEVARVVAVADAFDAMTSTRAYRSGRPLPAAVAELKRCAGTQFDPRMVGALVRALARYGWPPATTADLPAVRGSVPGPAGGERQGEGRTEEYGDAAATGGAAGGRPGAPGGAAAGTEAAGAPGRSARPQRLRPAEEPESGARRKPTASERP